MQVALLTVPLLSTWVGFTAQSALAGPYDRSGVPVRGCTVQPLQNPPTPHIETRFVPGSLTRDRFRADLPQVELAKVIESMPIPIPETVKTYRPPERIALAHPTNFGERYLRDVNGQPAYREPLLVLHETVSSGQSAINYFQSAQPNDNNQASYHALVMLDGTIVYLVPPDKRAFGAGQSAFSGPGGLEAIQTNRKFSASVNNFAYHVSLETPLNGRHNGNTHGGYTNNQYYSLAWLVAKTNIPENRITTHQGVDRSGLRKDPRSFDRSLFSRLLRLFPRTNEIAVGCPAESASRLPTAVLQ